MIEGGVSDGRRWSIESNVAVVAKAFAVIGGGKEEGKEFIIWSHSVGWWASPCHWSGLECQALNLIPTELFGREQSKIAWVEVMPRILHMCGAKNPFQL